MGQNYSPIYIDLDTGNRLFLDKPLNNTLSQLRLIQNTPSRNWTVAHNGSTNKIVAVAKIGDLEVYPDITIIDGNTISLNFTEPVSGEAIIFVGEQNIIMPSPTPSPTVTPTPSRTATPPVTPTPSVTPSVTPSITAMVSPTVTPTINSDSN